jgi:ketosteroid isomerase-like protein
MMIPLLLTLAAADTFGPTCRRVDLRTALTRYADTAKAMNPRRTAAYYMPDGVLIGPDRTPYTGRTEIEAFLAGFGGYKLGEQAMTLEWVKDLGSGLFESGGLYRQSGNDAKGAAFAVDGRFHANWRCTKAGWRVVRMQAGVEV